MAVEQSYRPPEGCLKHFWTLAEGDDESRISAANQLLKIIQSNEQKTEREQLTTYCVNRLVRGLGSGRKFARVGFSTALALILRQQTELKTKQVLACIEHHFKNSAKAFSKSEKAALHLGHTFALSIIVQSGRIPQVDGESLGTLVEDFMALAKKRSFLKPVCFKGLENLVAVISEELFQSQVWPKLEETLSLGWEDCTLDRISLLLVCRQAFPTVVNKKFIKKNWGSPLFGEDNDDNLISAIKKQTSSEKFCSLREVIIPSILKTGRDPLSIWKGFGEKMFSSSKMNVVTQHQLLSMEILSELVKLSSDLEEVQSLCLDSSVMKVVFMDNPTNNEALGKVLGSLVSNVCEKLKSTEVDVFSFVMKVLELEGEIEPESKKELVYIESASFSKIIELIEKPDIEKYVSVLIEFVKGNDNDKFFSDSGKKRHRQLEWCLLQLQQTVCSPKLSTHELQHSVLALFLRKGYFKAEKKNGAVMHCDFIDSHVGPVDMKKLCETFLFKCLNQLSTLNIDHENKTKNLVNYLNLLSSEVQYLQSLLSCKDVKFMCDWAEDTHDIWKKLVKRIMSLDKLKESSSMTPVDTAFRTLYLYMVFYLLSNTKTATELLQDIFICHDKSKKAKAKKSSQTEDPDWMEVLTEILLQLLSFQSHFARVIASQVFRLIIDHVNTDVIAQITQVLIPNKKQEMGMFQEEEDEEDDDEDEGEEEGEEKNKGGLLDDDLPSEGSEDDDDDDDDDDDEKEDEEDDESDDEDEKNEDITVDERLRASVKEALGEAAIDEEDGENDEEEELSDLSDSEMFKFDEALAEVFRQRKKKMGVRKAAEQKKRELGEFKLRVLDLVDVVIKSERCGDFLLDLLKPLLVLMFNSTREEERNACKRAKSSFQQLKKRCRGMKDSIHSEEEQSDMFQQLIELAERVKDGAQLRHIAWACCIMIRTSKVNFIDVLQETLQNVISKRKSRPLPPFFIGLGESDPVVFEPLSKTLIHSLKDVSVHKPSKCMACSLLTSLSHRRREDVNPESPNKNKSSWMKEAAKTVSELLLALDKEQAKGPLYKALLTLMQSLLSRNDVLSFNNIGTGLEDKIQTLKGKRGSDCRNLTRKVMSTLRKLPGYKPGTGTGTDGEKNGKKRKAGEIDTTVEESGSSSEEDAEQSEDEEAAEQSEDEEAAEQSEDEEAAEQSEEEEEKPERKVKNLQSKKKAKRQKLSSESTNSPSANTSETDTSRPKKKRKKNKE